MTVQQSAPRTELAVRVELNRSTFARMRGEAVAVSDPEQRSAAIFNAARFAAHTGTGVFRAPDLDHMLQELSYSLPTQRLASKRKGVLHVMTCAYPNGGHTRVVERWITQDSASRSHSVVATAQRATEIVTSLIACVEQSGGSTFGMLPNEPFLKRAQDLRALANRFEYVVLHPHMHDVVPVLALGACHDLPTIFFNHADHRFSLGMAHMQAIAETRAWGKTLSQTRRGIVDSLVLGIPLRGTPSAPIDGAEKVALRRTLGLPASAVIAIAAGAAHKFSEMMHYDMYAVAKICLQMSKDLHILMLGPAADTLSRFPEDIRSMQRITFVTPGDEAQFTSYVQASDFGLDTFPENGCTTLMDMLQQNLPVVSRHAPTGQMDYLLDDNAYCRDDDSFVTRVAEFVDVGTRGKAFERQHAALLHHNGPDVFRARLETLYATAEAGEIITPRAARRRLETATELDFLLALGC